MAQGILGVFLRLTQGYQGYFSGPLQVRFRTSIRHRDVVGTEQLVRGFAPFSPRGTLGRAIKPMDTVIDLEKTEKSIISI